MGFTKFEHEDGFMLHAYMCLPCKKRVDSVSSKNVSRDTDKRTGKNNKVVWQDLNIK